MANECEGRLRFRGCRRAVGVGNLRRLFLTWWRRSLCCWRCAAKQRG